MVNTIEETQNGLELQLAELQKKLKEAATLLDMGEREYNRLYHSRFGLLEKIACLLVQYENSEATSIANDLELLLAVEGIQRFAPVAGQPIPRDKCRVSRLEYNGIPPGLVASLMAPGFISTEGEVILPADVLESEPPADSKDKDGIESSPVSSLSISKAGQGKDHESSDLQKKQTTKTQRKPKERTSRIPPHPQIVPGISIVKSAQEDLGELILEITGMEKNFQKTAERLQQTFQKYTQLYEKHRLLLNAAAEVVRVFNQTRAGNLKTIGAKVTTLKKAMDKP